MSIINNSIIQIKNQCNKFFNFKIIHINKNIE